MSAWLPYRQPAEKRVIVKGAGWHVDTLVARDAAQADAKALDLDVRLAQMDADSVLPLAVDVRISVDDLRAECGLSEDARLMIYGAWRSEGALSQGVGERVALPPAASQVDLRLALKLDGARLHGQVHLAIRLVLAATTARRPVTAWRAGSVLWEQVITREVGQAERFPTVLLPFVEGSQVRPKGALWSLDFDSADLSVPVSGGLVMYLNADHPSAALLRGDVRTLAARTLQATLKLDLARMLVRIALTHDEFIAADGQWPAGSVGDLLRRTLRICFPRVPVAVLAERFKKEPVAIESLLQQRYDGYQTFAEAR